MVCARARQEGKGNEAKREQRKKLINAYDIYQLLVGEIGIPRREFLYDLQFWEVDRIIRGYRKRNHLTHQLLAECAYAAIYTMRDPKGKTVKDVFPALFDDEEEYHEPLDEQERNELVELMNSINSQNEKSTEA